MLHYSLLNLDLPSHSKAIAFPDDLMVLTRGDSVGEGENYTNLEMRKIQECAINNKLMFSENKSEVMLMSRRRRNEKETEIYVNNKMLQVNSLNYLGIILIANCYLGIILIT